MVSERAAAILSVGEEILAGDILDTNALEIGERLRQRGFRIRRIQVTGDGIEEIAGALAEACRGVRLLIVTGGLGPTRDDLTRDGLARALGVELEEDPEAVEKIAGFFRRIGRKMAASNRIQALRPHGSRFLDNRRGTAPGLAAELDGVPIYVLPGVPPEMRLMLEEQVLPELDARFGPGQPPARIKVRAHGLAESVAGDRIADLMGDQQQVAIGITVSDGLLTVSLTARQDDPLAGRILVEEKATQVEQRLGRAVFGRDDATLQQTVVQQLVAKGHRLAIAESCTGGLVSRLVTDVAGSSAVFLEGQVTYSNEAKMRRLGVPADLLEHHGAVSAEVAAAMAAGAAAQAGVEAAISTTGIAGPGGGTEAKPVGLVYLGLSLDGRCATRKVILSGDREMIRMRAARCALDLLRRGLAGTLEE